MSKKYSKVLQKIKLLLNSVANGSNFKDLPIFDKYIEFYQTGKLRAKQIFTILPSFLQSHNIKETQQE